MRAKASTPVLKSSNIKIGFIEDSSYGEFANQLFPNATKLGLTDWEACKKALIDKKVDAIYRDATEVKKIVYEENIITQSLYKSANEKRIPANTIIEFARVYGFDKIPNKFSYTSDLNSIF